MKRIGRYIIRGLLGRGSMGKVFRVELPAIGKMAALKIFAPDELLARMIGRETLRDIFVREATIIASLRHPHVVAIHDFDECDGAPFFVMDYFADNLGALIGEHYEIERESRVLSVDRALGYTRQTLQGLACLHDAGIVHRDIKPFNLLLTPWDSIQICDFGLSKLRGQSFQRPANLNVGSPYYAAPEQEEDPDRAQPAADLYSVGVMFYRMLIGRLPAAGALSQSYQPLSRIKPDLDDLWDEWMLQAIAPRSEDRFSSAAVMLRALDELTDNWNMRKENVCTLFPEYQRYGSRHRSPPSLRSAPLEIAPVEAVDFFNLDHLWRPRYYSASDFTPAPQTTMPQQTIVDQATGLVWQQAGSPFPRTWPNAKEYIDDLNQQQFGGRSDWRLPTIDELMSLLRPPPTAQDLCIASVFEATQRRLWSADRCSTEGAYYVDSELGFVGWQETSALFHVRGVCRTT